jgi:hypothetical protein
MPNNKPIGVAYSDPLLDSFAVGTSGSPVLVTNTGNVTSAYGSTSATDGDTRLSYNKLTFTAAGSGETLRAYTSIASNAGTVAVGGTVNGAHVTLDVDGAAKVSGAGNALRATLGGTSTNPGGTLAAIQADSNFASGGTWTNASFIRFSNSGTGTVAYLANVPTTGSGLLMAPHTTQVMTDSIRIVMADGNVRYIMCTTSAANRTGGA